MDLRSDLCMEQQRKSQKARAGIEVTAKGGVASEAGDSLAKTSDIGEES